MRAKFLCFFVVIGFSLATMAQDKQKAEELVSEGVHLHDAGKYDEAIQKYAQALAADAENPEALYEMSFTYYVAGHYDSSIDLSRRLLKMKTPDNLLKNVYINLGSSYDALKQFEKSIKAYNQGIKKFPDFYLLYFNKGVTYLNNNDLELGEQNFQQALSYNPFHVSSHYWLAKILYKRNKIPAIMSASMVCFLENGSRRAKDCSSIIFDLMRSGIKTDSSSKNITIYLPSDHFSGKKKENDFSAQELTLSLMAASSSISDSLHLDTEQKKMSFVFQLMCNGFGDNKKNKGFYWKFYAPFFYDLKNNEFTDLLVHFIFAQNNDYDAVWIQQHSNEVTKFSEWLKQYKWPVK
ncbi:MAG: tetratricopeptide repeat protein [Bacteroidetes bacterium]|nr:tetratricopeptide repeat protein [Bacteroidota bacterium]